ncbi:unnamed protein product [Closterium sp. Naga37s-1]|nr:unnamed protein product [Closterium sp. Naga37s-1]
MQDEVLSKVPIPEEHIYSIDDELSVVEAASDYEELMKELVEEGVLRTTQGVPFPRIDLILLGFGPDGHVASLFPNSPLLRALPAQLVRPYIGSVTWFVDSAAASKLPA